MTTLRRRLGALAGTAVVATAAVTVALVALGSGVSEGAPTLQVVVPASSAAPVVAEARSAAVSDDGAFAAVVDIGAGGGLQAGVLDMTTKQRITHPALAGVVNEVAT